jgi:hypothetical protein
VCCCSNGKKCLSIMSAVIKVRFPAIASQAVRTFKFTPETTVGEAIERVRIFFLFLFLFFFFDICCLLLVC